MYRQPTSPTMRPKLPLLIYGAVMNKLGTILTPLSIEKSCIISYLRLLAWSHVCRTFVTGGSERRHGGRVILTRYASVAHTCACDAFINRAPNWCPVYLSFSSRRNG